MALYHNVKGPVDYTVVGNPTIVDGVASGFSGSNYLSTSSLVPAVSNFEFNCKFTTGTALAGETYTLFARSNLRIGYTQEGYIGCRIPKNGTYATFQLSHSIVLTTNTTYTEKVTYNGNSLTLSLYDANNQLISSQSWQDDSLQLENGVISIGRAGSSTFIKNGGSIDLNETYIKVNGKLWFGLCPVEVQKHQLKGPVGYTVVGSPTIVDGIASGFSGSNYIRTSSKAPSNFPKEITATFNWTSYANDGRRVVGWNNGSVSVSGSHYISISGFDAEGNYSSLNGSTYFDYNTWYTVKVLMETNKTSVYVKSGNDWVLDFSADVGFVIPDRNITFGHSSSSDFFQGSIDLNGTYIKVNGKLWFYQPAPTKYIVKDGKLVWADPRIYLDNRGTTTRNYFSLQTLPKDDTYKVYVRVRPSSLKNNGIFTANSTNRFAFVLGYNGPVYARIFGSSNTAAGVNYAENDLIEMTASKEGFFGNVAGTFFNVAPSVTPTFSSPATSALLLNAGAGSTFPNDFLGKFYGIKIWSGGVLCEDVVPVPAGLKIGSFTVPSNGLFDMVKQQFYQNQGEETLPIGRDE